MDLPSHSVKCKILLCANRSLGFKVGRISFIFKDNIPCHKGSLVFDEIWKQWHVYGYPTEPCYVILDLALPPQCRVNGRLEGYGVLLIVIILVAAYFMWPFDP